MRPPFIIVHYGPTLGHSGFTIRGGEVPFKQDDSKKQNKKTRFFIRKLCFFFKKKKKTSTGVLIAVCGVPEARLAVV